MDSPKKNVSSKLVKEPKPKMDTPNILPTYLQYACKLTATNCNKKYAENEFPDCL